MKADELSNTSESSTPPEKGSPGGFDTFAKVVTAIAALIAAISGLFAASTKWSVAVLAITVFILGVRYAEKVPDRNRQLWMGATLGLLLLLAGLYVVFAP